MNDPSQPTLVFQSQTGDLSSNTSSMSRARVGLVAGASPRFEEESAGLLRMRLLAASLIISVVLSAVFVGNLISGMFALWWLRLTVVMLVASVATLLLRAGSSFSPQGLRALELIVFVAVAFQISIMLESRLMEFAARNDAISAAVVVQQFITAFCVLIFLYGTLIPNSWKRGLVVMFVMALLPYAVVTFTSWRSAELSEMLASNQARSPLPMTMVAALVSIFTAHVIQSIRREAFKAKQLGQYRLMEKLGAGGMGEVYKAEHMLLKRPCAIKLIKPANDRDALAVARFEKEVKLTAKLTHWNTVEVYDYGRTDDGTFYYEMELLPGMSLEQMVEQHGSLPPERTVYLLRQICDALREAHALGMIHRDIKPANIFVTRRGGYYDVAKLLDFGLVKDSDQPAAGSGSNASFSGTPHYMSPEQVSRYDEVDGRSDIYALGAVTYFLLTGQTPFSGRNSLEIIAAHLRLDVGCPSMHNPSVTLELDAIVLKCLAKQPSDRFQDISALMLALDSCSLSPSWDSETAKRWWTALETRDIPNLGIATPRATPISTLETIATDESAAKKDGEKTGSMAVTIDSVRP